MTNYGLAIASKTLTLAYYIKHCAPISPDPVIRMEVKEYKDLLGSRKESSYLRDLDKSVSVKSHRKAARIRELSQSLRSALADHVRTDYEVPRDCVECGNGYCKRVHLNNA